MTEQLPIDFSRALGEVAAQRCVAKAERVAGFDAEGARTFVLGWLRRHGPQSGEELVKQAKAHGFRGHDDRCFGSVFSVLARREAIRCIGFCARTKGHGTAGGRIWEAVG